MENRLKICEISYLAIEFEVENKKYRIVEGANSELVFQSVNDKWKHLESTMLENILPEGWDRETFKLAKTFFEQGYERASIYHL